jgi:hypothetical protein
MGLKVQALTGAGYRERSPGRLAQRTGYRERATLRSNLGDRPSSPGVMPTPPRHSGAKSLTRSASSCPSWLPSWTTPRTTSSPR